MILGHEGVGEIVEINGEKKDVHGRPLKKGDKMELDLSQQFCPNPRLHRLWQKGLGNITTSTTFGKQHIQLLRCKTCNKRFSERHHTVLLGYG
jgi:protein-arginine kinase activator protein McsA